MNDQQPQGGLVLGGVRPTMPEITVYPVAAVTIAEGGCGVNDATHHLKIVLPLNARELRIPFNKRGLRRVGRAALEAGGSPQAQVYETESEQT